MFTCRYAFNAIQLLKKRLTMSDVHNKLKCYVSEDSLFDFSKGDITRMRVEIHNILGSITGQYRSHRDTSSETPAVTDVHDVVMNLFNDSESDGEANDDDDDVAFTNDNHSSDCSGSVWSCGSDGDELMHDDEDEPLIYESNGDTIRVSGGSSNNNTTLNTFIQLGDVIEYRESSRKSVAKKGTIASIGALSTSQNIIGLDNGDFLHKGVHQVRRMSIKHLDQDGHLPNPSPVWKCLTKIIIITPYEDVFSDDEEEEEGEVFSWDHDSTATAASPPFAYTEQHSTPTQPDDDEAFNCDANANSNSWTPTKKRKRTSCGQTRNSVISQSQRVRREDTKLDRRRPTETFLWASPVREYNKAKGKVNELYVMSLQLGVVEKFHEKKIHLQKHKTQFMKLEKEFRRFLVNREKSGAISLD
eukprot:scaffold4393_cov78-Skeletonema_dohrnii-CCMP3373.AAC.1